MTTTPRFDLIGLVVADMAASLDFYRLLGLDLPAGQEKEPHVEVRLDGGVRLAFDTRDVVRSFDPAWETAPGGRHTVALAFACESPRAVDALHAEIVSAGHASHLAPFDAFWGQRYASVLDPDGNAVELFADLPQTAS